MISMAKNDGWTVYRRLLNELLPYWPHMLGTFVLSLLSAPLALLAPLPLKIAVDSVIGDHPLPAFLQTWLPAAVQQSDEATLWLAVLMVVSLAVLAQVRERAGSWLGAYTGEKLLRGFRARLFHHAQRLSLSYHDTTGTADSVYRIQYDAAAIQRVAVNGVVPFISSALTLAAISYVTIRINWRLALVALSVSPLVFLISRGYRKQLRGRSREVKALESSALSVVHEALGAVRVVKAFGQEGREDARFVRHSDEGMRARLKLELAEGRFGLIVALLTSLGAAAVLLVGIRGVRSGSLTLGDLLLVMGYVGQLHGPLRTIGKRMASMQSTLASAERAFALLDEAPEVAEHPNPRPLSRARGTMAFRDVSFAYDGSRPVLQHVSFEIEAGTCLGIAGATGAGKTTLVNLLTRFYDPTAGQILLDGVDLREYRVSDLRHQFAIVLQDPVLFPASIAENIAYARPEASLQEIIEAAKAANAHDFIVRLPDGYDTRAGERGMRLSGGERQRISLARAFLKNAPVLILDEPTSSVDVRTEAAIVEAMERLTLGRTTFIITHRESALKPCRLVLRMRDGQAEALEPGPAAAMAAASPWAGDSRAAEPRRV